MDGNGEEILVPIKTISIFRSKSTSIFKILNSIIMTYIINTRKKNEKDRIITFSSDGIK